MNNTANRRKWGRRGRAASRVKKKLFLLVSICFVIIIMLKNHVFHTQHMRECNCNCDDFSVSFLYFIFLRFNELCKHILQIQLKSRKIILIAWFFFLMCTHGRDENHFNYHFVNECENYYIASLIFIIHFEMEMCKIKMGSVKTSSRDFSRISENMWEK